MNIPQVRIKFWDVEIIVNMYNIDPEALENMDTDDFIQTAKEEIACALVSKVARYEVASFEED